ncbi:MAG TPA: hypothetical protein VF581_05735 [Flavobacterium sp.]|jgi:hypothetical protein
MATVTLPFKNPHVTLKNEVIDINYRSKKYKIALDNVSKIYLSRRRSNYLSAMFGNLLLMSNAQFKLYIHTKDNNSVSIEVLDHEKQYFVNLISRVRNMVKNNLNGQNTKLTITA